MFVYKILFLVIVYFFQSMRFFLQNVFPFSRLIFKYCVFHRGFRVPFSDSLRKNPTLVGLLIHIFPTNHSLPIFSRVYYLNFPDQIIFSCHYVGGIRSSLPTARHFPNITSVIFVHSFRLIDIFLSPNR